MSEIKVGTRVEFNAREYGPSDPYEGRAVRLTGTVTRPVWGRNASNVSIKSDGGRTFVRLIQSVSVIEPIGRWIMHPQNDVSYKPARYGSFAAFVRTGETFPFAFVSKDFHDSSNIDTGSVSVCFQASPHGWNDDHSAYRSAQYMTARFLTGSMVASVELLAANLPR